MIKFIKDNAAMLVNLTVIISFIGSILLWSHSKLRADMNEYKADMNEYRADMKAINARMDARLDATEQRIDHTYSLILDMMKEMKSESNKK